MERTISSFSSAVLAQYISQNMYRPDIKELVYIEAMHEYEEIKKKIERIIDKKKSSKPMSGHSQVRALIATLNDSKKLEALWARQDELSKIMFPDLHVDKEKQK